MISNPNNKSSFQNNGNCHENEAVVVLLGSAMTGKTTLVYQLIQNYTALLNRKYQPTVEEVYNRTFIVRSHKCKVRFVDTAPSYSFPAMQRIWIHRATAFILMCSRELSESIDHLCKLVQDIIIEHGEEKTSLIPIVIVINKNDLSLHEWQFMDEEIESALSSITKIPIPIVKISALNNENTTAVMESLWKQNELTDPNNELGVGKIKFDEFKPKVTIARRFSAFAISNIPSGLKPQSSESSSNQSGQDSAVRSPRVSMTPATNTCQGKRMSIDQRKASNVFFPINNSNNKRDNSEKLVEDLEGLHIGSEPYRRKWSLKKRFFSQRLTGGKKKIVSGSPACRENIPIRYECIIS